MTAPKPRTEAKITVRLSTGDGGGTHSDKMTGASAPGSPSGGKSAAGNTIGGSGGGKSLGGGVSIAGKYITRRRKRSAAGGRAVRKFRLPRTVATVLPSHAAA